MVKSAVNQTMPGYTAPDLSQPEALARLLRQALGRAAGRDRTEDLLALACRTAGRAAPPVTLDEVIEFVTGPLSQIVSAEVSPEKAQSLLTMLAPLLRKAVQDTRASEADPGEKSVAADEPPVAMVVDPQHDARSRTTKLLQQAGYRVLSAADGNVALAMCVRTRPTVLVSTLELPGLSGEKLVALLRVAFGEDAPKVLLLADDAKPPFPLDQPLAPVMTRSQADRGLADWLREQR